MKCFVIMRLMFVRFFILTIFVMSAASCETIQEPFKAVWGTSTKALEEARIDGVSKVYKCEFDGCFDAVLGLDRREIVKMPVPQSPSESFINYGAPPSTDEENNLIGKNKVQEDKKGFEVFMKDRIKSFIVVVGVPGSIDTTEVGIFFSRYNRESFKIEISSLSEAAKNKVADMVFNELNQKFDEIHP